MRQASGSLTYMYPTFFMIIPLIRQFYFLYPSTLLARELLQVHQWDHIKVD